MKSNELKDKVYILLSEATPISYQLRSRHTKYSDLTYFDGQEPRALRYCTNQRDIFIDKQSDIVVLGAIVFEDGKLMVPKNNTTLQKFLLHHPDNKENGGSIFAEFDPDKKAQEDLDILEKQQEAINTAFELEISDLEAVGRVLFKSKVDNMPTGELKRDLVIYARNNPIKFMELVNDSDIKLRNLAIRAVDMGIIGIKDDNTTVYWNDKSKKVITKLPFGSNPYSSLSQFFKTDEGVEVMQSIGVKLSS